jgi:hypothetical protein
MSLPLSRTQEVIWLHSLDDLTPRLLHRHGPDGKHRINPFLMTATEVACILARPGLDGRSAAFVEPLDRLLD